MPVTLNYFVEVDVYAEQEYYYGTIEAEGKTIYSHEDKLKSFAYKSDMVRDLHRIAAENGYEVVDINDNAVSISSWEEYL